MDRQKLLIIFGAAWLSAALLTWFLYTRAAAPRQEKTVQVAAAVRDLPAGTRVKRGDLKLVTMPEKDLPKSAVRDPGAAEHRALLYPVMANEPITTAKLSSLSGAEGVSATIPPGMRAVSVAITDASGAAGLIQPRAHVDVLFTRSGTMAEALTATVLEDVVVLSVGRTTEVQATPDTAAQAAAPASTVNVAQQKAVTLLVSPEESRKLELARNQGKLSLALRNPADKGRLDAKEAVTAEVLDPNLFTRVRRPTAVGGGAGNPNVRDPRLWAQLTGGDLPRTPKKAEKKEPPKPKWVVDVFKGDKHLQETFQ
jgi:pilus assembly protein CpaB